MVRKLACSHQQAWGVGEAMYTALQNTIDDLIYFEEWGILIVTGLYIPELTQWIASEAVGRDAG